MRTCNCISFGAVALVVATAVLPACSDTGDDPSHTVQAVADAGSDDAQTDADAPGLILTLSEDRKIADEVARPRTVEGEPLGEAETKRLLAQLSALPPEETAHEDFAFRSRTKPAPRTGD